MLGRDGRVGRAQTAALCGTADAAALPGDGGDVIDATHFGDQLREASSKQRSDHLLLCGKLCAETDTLGIEVTSQNATKDARKAK